MSAFLVNRNHIVYLVRALLDSYDNGRYLRYDGIPEDPVKLCELLRNENVSSILSRYPDTMSDPDNAPGDTSLMTEPFTLEEYCSTVFGNISHHQVSKSVLCYRYQSCEHDEWKESKASKICQMLIEDAARGMMKELERDGNETVWGAPQPIEGGKGHFHHMITTKV